MSIPIDWNRSIARFCIFVAIALCSLPSLTAEARVVRDWRYSDLVAGADAVVIATAVSTVEIADQQLPDELRGLADYVQCVATTFQIEGIVKGELSKDRLVLVHYQCKPAKWEENKLLGIVNGPSLVRFETGKELPSGEEVRGPAYLLFLKTTKDRRFVPVSGQEDPAFSIRRITEPDRDHQRWADEPKSSP